ncbi:MAG: hypothetical protein Tsb0014_03590 [Pleurocapsa sp.]
MSAKVILTIAEGKLKGKQHLFDSRTSCIIGRHSDCNLQLPNDKDHATISRYHCLLDINPPDIRIRDLGSRHGTYVNGKLIGKRQNSQTPAEGAKLNLPEYDLKDEDTITLSNTIFKLNIEFGIEKTAPILNALNNSQASQEIPVTLKLSQQKTQLEIDQILSTNKSLLNSVQNILNRAEKGEETLRVIKEYTLIKQLGQGGFGEVYLARHSQTNKLVALKVMLPQVAAQPYMVERFLRETETTKMLNHSNLVRLLDCCTADGLFFFTLEYCNQGTVIDLMKKRGGKLPIDEAINIITQVLDGLHYAHTEKNLIHRDIKPGNIFLTTTPDRKTIVKLGDYGLAKNFDMAGLSGQTLTGNAMGTPVFIPRQQVLNFKYALPDVDIWATAASLYNMLTGTYPRDCKGQDPFIAVLQSQPIPIKKRNPAIFDALANVIDLALKDNPQLHFKSALDFKNSLLEVYQ